MRRLIILTIVGILCLMALAQVRSSGSYPQVLSLCVLFVAAASFYGNNMFTGIVIFFPIAVAGISLFFGVEVQTILVCVAALLLTPGVSREFRKQIDKKKKDSDKNLFDIRTLYEKVKVDEEAVRAADFELEHQAAEIAKLYELTKRMSAHLEFEEILKVLSDFIKSNFKYQRAYLFTVTTRNSMPEVEKEYRIGDQRQERQSFEQLVEKEKISYALRLVKILNAARTPIKTAATMDRYLMQKLDLPEEVASFVGIPIYAKGRMSAVLAFEDPDLEDFERLMIAAGQFSLEMERSLLYEEVQALAIIDGLTNIYVRRHFMERFNEELDRSKRHKLNLSMLMIDIDHFKQKNDKFGHLVGDVILREVANLIKQNVREIDLVGRYGGEEFCVVLVDTNKLDAKLAGERIRRAIESYKFKAYDEVIDVTISAGISSFPQEGQTTGDLIEKADMALYEAKNKGRNRVCLTY